MQFPVEGLQNAGTFSPSLSPSFFLDSLRVGADSGKDSPETFNRG